MTSGGPDRPGVEFEAALTLVLDRVNPCQVLGEDHFEGAGLFAGYPA